MFEAFRDILWWSGDDPVYSFLHFILSSVANIRTLGMSSMGRDYDKFLR